MSLAPQGANAVGLDFEAIPINILLVDDEPKNLIALSTILDDPRYQLIRAESADEALLLLSERGVRPHRSRYPHAGDERLRTGPADQAA